MLTIVLLVVCGVLEAVIWLWRLRTGVKGGGLRDSLHAGLSTFFVCATRVMFIVCGVSSVLQGSWLLGGLAYCLSAALATALAHALVEWWKRFDVCGAVDPQCQK